MLKVEAAPPRGLNRCSHRRDELWSWCVTQSLKQLSLHHTATSISSSEHIVFIVLRRKVWLVWRGPGIKPTKPLLGIRVHTHTVHRVYWKYPSLYLPLLKTVEDPVTWWSLCFHFYWVDINKILVRTQSTRTSGHHVHSSVSSTQLSVIMINSLSCSGASKRFRHLWVNSGGSTISVQGYMLARPLDTDSVCPCNFTTQVWLLISAVQLRGSSRVQSTAASSGQGGVLLHVWRH